MFSVHCLGWRGDVLSTIVQLLLIPLPEFLPFIGVSLPKNVALPQPAPWPSFPPAFHCLCAVNAALPHQPRRIGVTGRRYSSAGGREDWVQARNEDRPRDMHSAVGSEWGVCVCGGGGGGTAAVEGDW